MDALRGGQRASIWLVLVLAQASARAGVLYTVDLGTSGLGQGGAFVAAPDDGSAVWYNPAALAAQRGLRIDVDAGLSRSQLEFDQDAAGGPIKSRDGVLPVGLFGASYGIGTDLTVGLFAYVPSSSSFMFDPKGQQQFQGIGGHYKLAFFHAAVAYRIRDQLSLGIALGPTYFHATQYNGISIAAADQDPYNTFYAVTVTTDVQAPLFFTTNLGVSYTPWPHWAFGVSIMPPFDVRASGTIHLSSPLVDAVGQVDGDTVDVHLKFPTIGRIGARYWPRDDVSVELAGVYEGWSRFASIQLEPHLTVAAPSLGIDTTTVPPFELVKGYKDVVSVRAGTAYELGRYVLRGGAYFETAGSPPSRIDITAPEAKKLGLTLGATVHLDRAFSVDVAIAHAFFWDVTVADSQLQILNVIAPTNTGNIGNGTYRTSLDFAQLAVRYQR